jgi:hypothetical protein
MGSDNSPSWDFNGELLSGNECCSNDLRERPFRHDMLPKEGIDRSLLYSGAGDNLSMNWAHGGRQATMNPTPSSTYAQNSRTDMIPISRVRKKNVVEGQIGDIRQSVTHLRCHFPSERSPV